MVFSLAPNDPQHDRHPSFRRDPPVGLGGLETHREKPAFYSAADKRGFH